MEETYVFIDAGYLSKIAFHLGDGNYLKCDINQLANTFAKEQGLWNVRTFFYTAPPFQNAPPTREEAERRANYDRFVTKLKRIPNFQVREGRCQKINGGYNQKGVDTLLTMDLMKILSKKNNVKKIILLACDTDFVPVLNEIREKDIEVVLYYYTDRIRKSKFSMSNYLFTSCDKKCIISKEHFERSNREN